MRRFNAKADQCGVQLSAHVGPHNLVITLVKRLAGRIYTLVCHLVERALQIALAERVVALRVDGRDAFAEQFAGIVGAGVALGNYDLGQLRGGSVSFA